MAIAQPISSSFLNNPDHSALHRIIAADVAAPAQSLNVISSGNVGIGTTAPGEKLHVGGNIIIPNGNYYEAYSPGGYKMQIFGLNGSQMQVGGINGGITPLSLYENGSEAMTINGGNVGIGTTSPTAYLHLKAGTATANTAPIKITPGVVNTTPVSGCIESDGTHLYWVDSGGNRLQLDNA